MSGYLGEYLNDFSPSAIVFPNPKARNAIPSSLFICDTG